MKKLLGLWARTVVRPQSKKRVKLRLNNNFKNHNLAHRPQGWSQPQLLPRLNFISKIQLIARATRRIDKVIRGIHPFSLTLIVEGVNTGLILICKYRVHSVNKGCSPVNAGPLLRTNNRCNIPGWSHRTVGRSFVLHIADWVPSQATSWSPPQPQASPGVIPKHPRVWPPNNKTKATGLHALQGSL